jgi:VanZ family protein
MPTLFLLSMALVTILLMIEIPPKHGSWRHWDKLQHVSVFFALSVSGRLAFPKNADWIYICLAAYGATMEVLQGKFTITREASAYDWIADIAGIALCMLIAYFFARDIAKKNE